MQGRASLGGKDEFSLGYVEFYTVHSRGASERQLNAQDQNSEERSRLDVWFQVIHTEMPVEANG